MNISRQTKTKRKLSFRCLTIALGIVILGIFGTWIHVALSISHRSFAHVQSISQNNSTAYQTFPKQSNHPDSSSSSFPGYGISPVKLKLPTPVFVVGFPKSGTTSVWSFFHCSGVIAQHYCCCNDKNNHPPCDSKASMATCIIQNMRKQRQSNNNDNNNQSSTRSRSRMLDGCGNYDVYAQMDGERWTKKLHNRVFELPLENGTSEIIDNTVMRPIGQEMRHFLPQHFLLEQLHRDYPQATLLLPLRNTTQWVKSAMNWFHMRGRFVNEYRAQDPSMPRPGRSGAAAWLKQIYEEHADYVRDFVQQHPSHTLIEFHIHQEDAGEILGKAFGLSPTCWGHYNKMGSRAKFNYSASSFTNDP